MDWKERELNTASLEVKVSRGGESNKRKLRERGNGRESDFIDDIHGDGDIY